ncbi:MAG: PTS sugar transporter subunit IIA [Oscillospiraceae bacterium]|nr:PTS sugar transporter subunit IIA [Oscillospiraceae bacterium]
MDIAQLLPASRIRLGVRVADRAEANRRLTALLEADGCLLDRACFERDLQAREAQSSTAVQGGLALPHARSEGVEQPAAALLVLGEPLDCCSMDGVPVDMLLMIASPQDSAVHMQAIAALAMALEREGVRDTLRRLERPEDAAALLAEGDAPVPAEECGDAQQPRILVVTACPSGIAHT